MKKEQLDKLNELAKEIRTLEGTMENLLKIKWENGIEKPKKVDFIRFSHNGYNSVDLYIDYLPEEFKMQINDHLIEYLFEKVRTELTTKQAEFEGIAIFLGKEI